MTLFSLTTEAWSPVTAPLTNGSDNRSRETYLRVIAQFEVTKNKRYAPVLIQGRLITYCNVFVSDCTRAFACEIPHWWHGKEQTANENIGWLNSGHGALHGWVKNIDETGARVSALVGRPTVAVWRNPNPNIPGHMAMVLPDHDALVIAQAGRENFERCRLNVGFGDRPVEFWSHA